MRFPRKTSFFLVMIVIMVLSGCDTSSSDYFFEKPTSLSILTGVKCANGKVSYMGFVVDNTDKYGARLMKISGCGLTIDDGFDDDLDGKTGLYIGGTGVWNDQIEIKGEVFIAVASSGYTDFEHWKDKDEEKKYENHKGRIVFRKLGKDFKHDPVYNKSILLGFYPSIVKAFNKDGFFVAGSSFGKNYIGFVDLEGKASFNELAFEVSTIVAAGETVYLFDDNSGSIYSIDESLKLELIVEKEPDPSLPKSGMAELSNDRLAVFSGREVTVYNDAFQQIDSIMLPEGYVVSSIVSAKYSESFEYRKFSNEDMSEKVQIFKKEEEDSDSFENDDDTESSDTDTEVSDNDTDSDSSDTVYDASEGDVVWIASSTGSVIAYDMANKSWMATKYSDEEAASNAVYYNEMRPYVNSTYSSFPKNGKTDADNIPVITDIYAMRGLPFSVVYRLSFEGTIEGTVSDKGVLNDEKTTLKDMTAEFENIGVDPETDSVVLMNKDNTSECTIPWDENVVMDVTEIVSPNEIGVNIEKYSDHIEKCYGSMLRYALFPKERYSVSREDDSRVSFAGRAVEHPSDYKGADFSFSDDMVSVSIKRTMDEVLTAKETTFYIKINPGVPFVGFSSADIMTSMFSVFPGRILMFSPFTRRIVEYDIQVREIVEEYK